MNKFRFTISVIAIAMFMFAFASLAQAQATRTWVSGVGDDVNPCSRTAPCKTFAGAISKTAVDGEIDALDPAGYGAVTITKAITIDGNGWGSILAAGTNGVNVSIQATSGSNTVQLRNISINGAATGLTGINLSGTTFANVKVFVENCVIFGFRAGNGRGISDPRTVAGSLFVMNTLIKNNSGAGIILIGNSGTVDATIENVQSEGNGDAGFIASGGAKRMFLRNCTASKNGTQGFKAELAAGVQINNCFTTFNGTAGIQSDSAAGVSVARTLIAGNSGNGIGLGGGTIVSYGNNEVSANAGNENFSAGGTPLK